MRRDELKGLIYGIRFEACNRRRGDPPEKPATSRSPTSLALVPWRCPEFSRRVGVSRAGGFGRGVFGTSAPVAMARRASRTRRTTTTGWDRVSEAAYNNNTAKKTAPRENREHHRVGPHQPVRKTRKGPKQEGRGGTLRATCGAWLFSSTLRRR